LDIKSLNNNVVYEKHKRLNIREEKMSKSFNLKKKYVLVKLEYPS